MWRPNNTKQRMKKLYMSFCFLKCKLSTHVLIFSLNRTGISLHAWCEISSSTLRCLSLFVPRITFCGAMFDKDSFGMLDQHELIMTTPHSMWLLKAHQCDCYSRKHDVCHSLSSNLWIYFQSFREYFKGTIVIIEFSYLTPKINLKFRSKEFEFFVKFSKTCHASI